MRQSEFPRRDVGGPATPSETGAPYAPRVLLIDDCEPLRTAYARILTRHGYRVETAHDAISALQALRGATFDLVISDIEMPGMSGLDMVESLRSSHIDVPVVLITGNPQIQTAMESMEHAVTRYLVKPVEHQTLVNVASSAIRLHGVARAKRLALDNAGLRSLVDELTRAQAAAQAASLAKSAFLGQMSHELRTPLTHIMGFTELALDTELSPEQRLYLETSRRSATLLLALVENILQFSNLNAGASSLEVTTIAMRGALAETTQPLLAAAERGGLTVTVDVDPALPDVLAGDAAKFRQVIEHIVGNALKFTKRGGTVAIRVGVESSHGERGVAVRVSVSDSGVGIPPEVRERVFGVFSQADSSSSREHGGAGLGLTISRLLVQLMGGAIAIDSAPGRGTTVTFTARFETPREISKSAAA